MKFKFPLQKVLDHRQVVQDLAQKEFQEAQGHLFEMQNELQRLQTGLSEARAEVQVLTSQRVSGLPGSLQQIHEFTLLQDRKIQMQRAKVLEAEKLVEEKREILRAKAIDTKMLERLKEKKRTQFQEEMKIREQHEVDELNILRFEPKDGE